MTASDAHLIETRLEHEAVYTGSFLKVCKDRVRLPSGDSATREYIEHPGAVAVVAWLGKEEPDQLVLERQYRYPLQQVMLEIPAGKIDPQEDTWDCIQRELKEETGYVARQWARVALIHPVIAYATERIEIWFARDLILGDRSLDEGEFLDVLTLAPDALVACALRGEVTDAKTLSALFWLQNYRSGAVSLQWLQSPLA